MSKKPAERVSLQPRSPLKMRLQYIGRQGSCRYYWRVLADTLVLYAKVDGGLLQPVAGGPWVPKAFWGHRKRRESTY